MTREEFINLKIGDIIYSGRFIREITSEFSDPTTVKDLDVLPTDRGFVPNGTHFEIPVDRHLDWNRVDALVYHDCEQVTRDELNYLRLLRIENQLHSLKISMGKF